MAREFVDWLDVPPGGRWLDVGCGSGALTETAPRAAAPAAVVGVDTSAAYVAYAGRAPGRSPRVVRRRRCAGPRPCRRSFDAVASSLVLNFLPDPGRGVAEMARVVRPGGVVAGYVWDYAGEMQLMRRFWDAAVALDPAAADLDEGRRMAGCNPPALEALFSGAGLAGVETRGIDAPTVFAGLRRLLGAVRGRPGAGARLLRLTARGSPRGAPGAASRDAPRRGGRLDPADRPRLGGARHPTSRLSPWPTSKTSRSSTPSWSCA